MPWLQRPSPNSTTRCKITHLRRVYTITTPYNLRFNELKFKLNGNTLRQKDKRYTFQVPPQDVKSHLSDVFTTASMLKLCNVSAGKNFSPFHVKI